jgi:hypothetical protein
MNIFSISSDAIDRLKKVLSINQCHQPVIVLIDIANLDNYMMEIKKSIIDNKNKDEVVQMARDRYREIDEELVYYMTAIVSEKATINPKELFYIDGIAFAMNSAIRKSLCDYCLLVEDGRFKFKNGDSVVTNLQSLYEKNKQTGSE